MTSNLYMIGDRLREERLKNGFTQEKLAELISVSRITVSAWERGAYLPATEVLIKLCDLYHCDMDFLMCRMDNRTHDLQFIQDQTGLSEKSISVLIEWKDEEGTEKFWPKYLSSIIEDHRFSEIMKCISSYLFSKRIEAKAAEKEMYKEAMGEITNEMAMLYQISRIFTNIVEQSIN